MYPLIETANIVMNSKVLSNIPQYECSNGRIYFTDIISLELSSLEFQNQCPDSPYEDCCLYLNTTNCNRCLTPSDLNWYLDYILGFIGSYESYYSKYIIDFELISGSILGVKPRVPDLWIMYFDLGNINCTHQPMDD